MHADCCGELGPIPIHSLDNEFRAQHGDRIAQPILEKIRTSVLEEMSALDDTGRGAVGFGSTGMQSSPADNSKRILEFLCQ